MGIIIYLYFGRVVRPISQAPPPVWINKRLGYTSVILPLQSHAALFSLALEHSNGTAARLVTFWSGSFGLNGTQIWERWSGSRSSVCQTWALQCHNRQRAARRAVLLLLVLDVIFLYGRFEFFSGLMLLGANLDQCCYRMIMIIIITRRMIMD